MINHIIAPCLVLLTLISAVLANDAHKPILKKGQHWLWEKKDDNGPLAPTAVRTQGYDTTSPKWSSEEEMWPQAGKGKAALPELMWPDRWDTKAKANTASKHDKISYKGVSSQLLYMSQVGQDEILLDILDYPSNGFFVDLATNDYAHLSNTLALERYWNWTGICIEPHPRYHANIVSYRRCDLVANPIYSSTGDSVRFHLEHYLSGIVGKDQDNTKESEKDLFLNTVTLTDVLDFMHAPPLMEYFSLDVEGGEGHVLQGLNMEKYKFKVVSLERPTPEVHEMMGKNGYWFMTSLPLRGGRPTKSGKKWHQEPITERNYEKSYKHVFGEVIYIHKSIPNFEELMNLYRPHTYYFEDRRGGVPKAQMYKDQKFMKDPAWPPNK
jgi:hypothetical protein